ncbi:MAG: hypothetical protein WCD35_15785 [Mycobacteriales bacterium]
MTDLSALGEGTGGLWTRAQALALVSSDRISSFLHDGSWQSPFRGVYGDGGCQLAAVQWGFAAVLASGGAEQPKRLARTQDVCELRAVACARTAARAFGIPLIDDDDPATGALDRHAHDVATWQHLRTVRSRSGLDTLHRHQLAPDRSELVRHVSGLWLTSPPRTLLDLAALVQPDALVCAFDHCLNRGLVRREELLAQAEHRRRLPWTRSFVQAVGVADGGAQSPAETLARLALKPHLPGLRCQVELYDDAARLVARFDLGDEELRLAVESDGKRGHAGSVMVAKDRRRDRRTEVYGWRTERVTWFELRRDRDAFVRRVLAVAERRRGRR